MFQDSFSFKQVLQQAVFIQQLCWCDAYETENSEITQKASTADVLYQPSFLLTISMTKL